MQGSAITWGIGPSEELGCEQRGSDSACGSPQPLALKHQGNPGHDSGHSQEFGLFPGLEPPRPAVQTPPGSTVTGGSEAPCKNPTAFKALSWPIRTTSGNPTP
ncbi:hypothetical protein MGR01S_03120 [Meiothermus granaticius NBRC 107808]|nr:hypothetical protein MGR01S_03120 [Meiothermus granaticius NBRC 107808]